MAETYPPPAEGMDDIDFPANDNLHAESSQNATRGSGLRLVLPPLNVVKALKAKKSFKSTTSGSDGGGVKPKIPRPVKLKQLKEVLTKLITQIKKKDDYAFFLTPVDVSRVAGYADLIKNPMDLGTMTTKVERGRYRSLEEFASDLRLVTSNAKLFNPPGTIYHTEADRIEAWALDHITKAAGSVIEYEADWNIDIEHEDERPLYDDEEARADKSTPMDVDGTRARSPSVASTQTPAPGPRRKGKKQLGMLSESLDEDGHLPGYKDGVSVFPPNSEFSDLMLALKLKGKRYRTKKERLRMERGGPPFSAEGALDYAEMEDPFTILSTFLPDPPSKPLLTALYAEPSSSDQHPFPGPVTLPLDRPPLQVYVPPPKTSSSMGRTKLKRRHWTVIRNAPRVRARVREEEDISAPSMPVREPHTIDWGAFATLVGKIAEETHSNNINVDFGSNERLLDAIRRSVDGDLPDYRLSGDVDMNGYIAPGAFFERRAKQAEDYIRDAVYGGVDGVAYVRSLAEFTRQPEDFEHDRTTLTYPGLGMPLAKYVEQTIVDHLTEGQHRLLREASHCLESSPLHRSIDPSVSNQVNLSLNVYPLATRQLSELRQLSTQKLDMASLIHNPDELYVADNEWAGAAYMEEQRRKVEQEREKVLAESPTQNAADYLAFAIQSHKEAEAPEKVYEGPEVLTHALESSADMITELSSQTRDKSVRDHVSSDAMDVDSDETGALEDKKPDVDETPQEDPSLRKLRLNLLALAKRAPLDTIAKLPADLVPARIRDIVPAIQSTS